MFHLDPLTLLLANVLVGLALVLVVMSTRVGMAGRARGMRTWLAGDVVLLTGQACIALDAVPLGQMLQLPQLTLSSGLVTAGIALHLAGIHRHRQPEGQGAGTPVLVACACGLVVGTASLLLREPAWRAALLNVSLIAMLVVTIARNLLPVRRFLGVRIMLAAMGFALVVNCLMLASALARPEVVQQGAITGLLVNMVMTMVTTSAFVLWLQEEFREYLRHTAQTDALTGVLNRHGVLAPLRAQFTRARLQGPPLSVALCDIDHFKRVNDTQGHAAGDAVLQAFADGFRTLVRHGDLVARWGGEEFLLVLPDTDAAGAKALVERIRTHLPAATAAATQARQVTFSAGVASTADQAGATDIDALLASADNRLYAAKATRDTIVAA
jgi:diguanylate cyclase (GGDEF)-like protein